MTDLSRDAGLCITNERMLCGVDVTAKASGSAVASIRNGSGMLSMAQEVPGKSDNDDQSRQGMCGSANCNLYGR